MNIISACFNFGKSKMIAKKAKISLPRKIPDIRYDFSTRYKIPHNKLKFRLFQIRDNCFLNKNGTWKYNFLVIGKQDTYFVRHHSDSPYKYSEADIKSMLGFRVDNMQSLETRSSHNSLALLWELSLILIFI
jgi:hypothetical protein